MSHAISAECLTRLASRSDPKIASFAGKLLRNLEKPTERLEQYEGFFTKLLNDEVLLSEHVRLFFSSLSLSLSFFFSSLFFFFFIYIF